MKDKIIALRVDEDIVKDMDFLQQLNGYKNRSETVRRVIYKEFIRETYGRGFKRAEEEKMASDKSFFIVCNLNKYSEQEYSTTLNKRTFVNAPNAQKAVDDVVAEYKEQGYTSVECIQVFQRIMNGDSFFWNTSEENK